MKPQDPQFQQQLERARAGHRPSLEGVLATSRPDLRRYAEYHCPVNDVEDAVQESLLQVSRKLSGLRALEAYTSWLFRIVKRECNRIKRARRMLVLLPSLEEIDGLHYPAPDGIVRDVAAALAAMPAHYRDVILLRDVEGLTIAELSARLDLHPEAAKARVHRARALARQLLSPEPCDVAPLPVAG